MKNLGFGLLAMFFAVQASGQEWTSFPSLDKKTIMPRLFDGATFNTKNEALWKPNYAERLTMPVSEDKYCHTVLDTTMLYSNEGNEFALIVFTTYQYEMGKRIDCHGCAPTLSLATFKKEGTKWTIQSFEKNFGKSGSNGKRGKLGLEKLGDDFFCLKISSEFFNMGSGSADNSYFDLFGFDNVFSFSTFKAVDGTLFNGESYSEETKMKTIPTGEYFKIELTSKRSDKSSPTKKVFQFSADEGKYIEVK